MSIRYPATFGFVWVLAMSCGVSPTGSLSSQDSEEKAKIDRCVADLKRQIASTDQPIPDHRESTVDDIVPSINAMIRGKVPASTDFSYSSVDNGIRDVSVAYQFDIGAQAVDVSHELSIDSDRIAPPFGGEGKILAIKHKIDIKVFQAPLLVSHLVKTFRVDYQNGCQEKETDIILTRFTPMGKSVDVHELKHDLSNALTSEEKGTISVAAAESDYKFRSFIEAETELTLQMFQGLSEGELTFVFKSQGKEPFHDKNTNSVVELDKYSLTLQHQGQILGHGIGCYSPTSKYAHLKWDLDNSVNEEVKKEIWDQVLLSIDDSQQDKVTFEGFTHLDFQTNDLEYTVRSPVELKFENHHAYFAMNAQNQDSNGRFVYQVKNREPVIHQELSNPFPRTVPEQAKKYLLETHYYTISDPGIQNAVSELKKTLNGSQSQAVVIHAILTAVNRYVGYDYQALEQGSVTVVRACDVLERGTGVCQHFSALFVTFARALGVPARQVLGLSLSSEEGDKFSAESHAWVEVLISGKHWLPLEPQRTDLFIEGSSYFPFAVYDIYERQAGGTNNIAEYVHLNRMFKEMIFTKTGGGL